MKILVPALVIGLLAVTVGGAAATNDYRHRLPDIQANVALMETKTEATAMSGGNYVLNGTEVGGNYNVYNKTTIDTGRSEAVANSTNQVNTPGCGCEQDILANVALMKTKTSADAISGANTVDNLTSTTTLESNSRTNGYHHKKSNHNGTPNTVTNEVLVKTGESKATANSLNIVNSSYSLL